MKPKHKPRYVVLTVYDIAIAEFNNARQLKSWKRQYSDTLRPIKKVLKGKQIKTGIYLPIF